MSLVCTHGPSSVLQKFVVTYAKQVVVVLSLIKPSRYQVGQVGCQNESI